MTLFLRLGDVSAQYLQADQTDLMNDPATLSVLPALLNLNRRGCITFNSQVGVIEPRTRQRAFVCGFISKTAWPYMMKMMAETEFIVHARGYSPQAETDNNNSQGETEDRHQENIRIPLTVEIQNNGRYRYYSRTNCQPWPWEDACLNLASPVKNILRTYSNLYDQLKEQALIVQIMDPVWGRQDALISMLNQYLERWKQRCLAQQLPDHRNQSILHGAYNTLPRQF